MSSLSNMLAAVEQAEAVDLNQAAIWLKHFRKTAPCTGPTKLALDKLIKKLQATSARKNRMAAKLVKSAGIDF